MKITRLQTSLALILTLSAQHAAAQTLSLDSTSVGSLSHDYSGFMGGEDSQSVTFGSPTVELANYNTIQLTVSAPAGEMWNVSYDGQGLSSADIDFLLYYGTSIGPSYANITSSSIQFNYVTGGPSSLGTFNNNTSIPNAASTVWFQTICPVQGDFSFTSFTISMTYDNSQMASTALTSFFSSGLQYDYQPSNFSAPDPGALMTMVPVPTPEPSTLALLGMGGAGLIILRRKIRG